MCNFILLIFYFLQCCDIIKYARIKTEMTNMNEEIYRQARQAASELCDAAKLKKGDIMVVGR